MTRRERRERERAAAEAAERARAAGPQQTAGPQQPAATPPPQATPPTKPPGTGSPAGTYPAPAAGSAQTAGPQSPVDPQQTVGSPRPASESWSPRPAPSQRSAPSQQSSWHSGAPQDAGSRPVIKPASRSAVRTGSGPVHQTAAHTQALPASPAGPGGFGSGPRHAGPGTGRVGSAPGHTGSGPGHTAPGGGGATAQSVFAASASSQTGYGTPPPAGGQAAGSAAAASAAGAKRTDRKRNTEYEPLGPVRGTIRTFGELCITAGMVLILFVVWQLWWTDIAANKDNEVLADQLITEWRDNPANELPDDPDTPYVAEPVDENSGFGIMYVPRFGDDYYRTVAEGVSMEPVLNRMGVGRYPSSAMPGEVGNFAIAGHRVTYGKPLNQIHQLRPGDEIIVQTADGYYTYTFRNFEIVLPDATEVLSAVPMMPEYKGKDRIMTLTACNPMFSARERYVAYAELTDWTPVGDGAPESIADSPAYDKVGGEA